MPLILMVGLPSSGKTTRAREIQKYFRDQQHKEVILISDNEIISNMNMDKNVLYLGSYKLINNINNIIHLVPTSYYIFVLVWVNYLISVNQC